jgi:succinylarginine dihydrolase
MWVANAATVSPSPDTADGRVHFTPANLAAHFHRSLEAPTTTAVLRAIFSDAAHFAVHDPLPAAPQLGDEGAANHTRFAPDATAPGVEFFVYGRHGFGGGMAPTRYPARQTSDAFAAIARRHGLSRRGQFSRNRIRRPSTPAYFHNDVIGVGQGSVLFCHERAYVDQRAVLADLAQIGPHSRRSSCRNAT